MNTNNKIQLRNKTETKCKKILIVDDDHNFIEIVSRFIQQFNHEPVIAYDGIQAVKLYKKKQPYLVLMDLHMSTINGFEASSRILKWDPKAKIIFVTAHGTDSRINDLMREGVLGVIDKPINSTTLKNLLNEPEKASEFN